VAQRFSLKDNPIFQKFVPHTPPDAPTSVEENQEDQEIEYEGQNLTVKERLSEDDAHNMRVEKTSESSSVDVFTSSNQQVVPLSEEPSQREGIGYEGQNLTVKERLSEDDAQKLPLTHMSVASLPQVLSSSVAPTHSTVPRSAGTEFPLQDHLDKALFFGFYNEVADELLPTLPPAAQVLYSRLFRLSYGFNRNYCTVSQSLLMERTGLSRNTIRTALQTLLDDRWIQIIGAGNRVSTTYRVILPREKHVGEQSRSTKIDTQNLRVKNRHSEFEGQNVGVNDRGSEFDVAEGQKRDRQNLSGSPKKVHTTSNSNDLRERPSKFDAQDLPVLLFTHRSSTLSEQHLEDSHTSENSMLLSTRELVDKFYSLLGQRVSKSKRKKSLDECLSLLQEGFTVEEIDYTISWLITHHPTTGSFSRLPHFIDQALKARDLQHRPPQYYAPGTRESKDDQRRQQQERDEAQQQERIEAAKASLSPSALAALREEAEQCVAQEHPNIKFGRDTLVRLKLEDLLIKQYLSQPSEPF
jgi:helix-turn-helix protein